MRFVILALLLVGCAKSSDVAKTAAPAPVPVDQPGSPEIPVEPTPVPVAAPKCASSPALGDWKNGPLTMVTASIAADCSLRINACGTTYEIDLVDPLFSEQYVPVRVRSYDFIQDGCLRPGPDVTCRLVAFRDTGLQRDVLSFSCPSDNGGGHAPSMSFFRPY